MNKDFKAPTVRNVHLESLAAELTLAADWTPAEAVTG
jgi:hypothetical protein